MPFVLHSQKKWCRLLDQVDLSLNQLSLEQEFGRNSWHFDHSWLTVFYKMYREQIVRAVYVRRREEEDLDDWP